MDDVLRGLSWLGLVLFSLFWIYVAVRMAGRAVIRTLGDYRETIDNRKVSTNGKKEG